MSRWRALKNRYSNERANLSKIKSGSAAMREWPLMQQLSFLSLHMTRRRTLANALKTLKAELPNEIETNSTAIGENVNVVLSNNGFSDDILVNLPQINATPLLQTDSNSQQNHQPNNNNPVPSPQHPASLISDNFSNQGIPLLWEIDPNQPLNNVQRLYKPPKYFSNKWDGTVLTTLRHKMFETILLIRLP